MNIDSQIDQQIRVAFPGKIPVYTDMVFDPMTFEPKFGIGLLDIKDIKLLILKPEVIADARAIEGIQKYVEENVIPQLRALFETESGVNNA